MKVRAGFVSNSSSSSFIVGLRHKPKDANELHRLMFPNGDTIVQPYGISLTSRQVANRVWEDIQDIKTWVASDNQVGILAQELSSSGTDYNEFDESQPEFPNWTEDKEESQRLWDQYDSDCMEWGIKAAIKFITDNPDCEFFIVEYSDDIRSDSVLEYGEIFENLPCIKISKH